MIFYPQERQLCLRPSLRELLPYRFQCRWEQRVSLLSYRLSGLLFNGAVNTFSLVKARPLCILCKHFAVTAIRPHLLGDVRCKRVHENNKRFELGTVDFAVFVNLLSSVIRAAIAVLYFICSMSSETFLTVLCIALISSSEYSSPSVRIS